MKDDLNLFEMEDFLMEDYFNGWPSKWKMAAIEDNLFSQIIYWSKFYTTKQELRRCQQI